MKKFSLAIVFALISISVFGQTSLMENEVKIQRFGKEVIYKTLDNKPLEGHYKIADRRGNYSDLHFKNGKKHGEVFEYDYKGRKLSHKKFKNGRANGLYQVFNQNGQIKIKGTFIDGIQNGKWEYFDDKGKPKTVENFKNGKKDGKWWKKKVNQYNYTSIITENYKDDQHFGHSEERGENGVLNWEREYSNESSYTHKEYYRNGKLRFSEVVINGNKDGQYKKYNEKGVKIEQGQYKDDAKTGIWKEYDDEGNLVSETPYAGGVENGEYRKYFSNNKIEEKGMYESGAKNGVWEYYNLDGKLVKKANYDRGYRVSVENID